MKTQYFRCIISNGKVQAQAYGVVQVLPFGCKISKINSSSKTTHFIQSNSNNMSDFAHKTEDAARKALLWRTNRDLVAADLNVIRLKKIRKEVESCLKD